MIDDHRDPGDETTLVLEDIEHLDFDVPCKRCGAAGSVVATWVGVCAFAGQKWWFCETCASLAGPCVCHGNDGHYEVLS